MDIKKHSYLLELFVVFIGLSLAFTLDRVWDNHKQSLAEENYLNGFYRDITTDQTDLDTSITDYSENVERLRNIIRKIDKSGIPEDSLFTLAQIMASQSKFIPQNITYETITSSGSFGVISNYKLRESIARLYTKYNAILFVDETFNKYISDNVFPFIQNNFDFLGNTLIDKNLARNPVFKNMVVFYYSIYSAKLNNLKAVKAIADEVIGLLNNELGKS